MPVKMPDLEATTARKLEFLRAGGFAKKNPTPQCGRSSGLGIEITDAVVDRLDAA